MTRQRNFHVYILTNRSGSMYTGMTTNLIGRADSSSAAPAMPQYERDCHSVTLRSGSRVPPLLSRSTCSLAILSP